MPVVVGVDLAAGRGTTEVAALAFDGDDEASVRTAPTPGPSPAAAGEGSCAGRPAVARFLRAVYRATQSDDEIVAAAGACAPSVIAIDAPLSLPAIVLAALTGATTPADASGATDGQNAGASQQHLSPHHPSPYTRAAERDPIWRQLGVRPFPVSFLGGLTFRALTLLPRLRAAAPGATIIEVFPTATLAALGIRYQPTAIPAGIGNADANADAANSANAMRNAGAVGSADTLPSTTPLTSRSPLSRRSGGGAGGGGRPPAKTTPARRAATQAGLTHWIDDLPEPNTELFGADLLDALAAALTAVAYARGHYLAVGDPAEGQIILPTWQSPSP